jgi:hypothetical protein
MKVRIVPKSLLNHLNRWDAPHVLGVAKEMDSRDIDLDDPAGAKACSDDLKFLEEHKQKVRVLPCPPQRTYP